MPSKNHRVPPSRPITRVQFVALRRDVDRLFDVAREMEAMRKECETNLRRCAELQYEIDKLKQLVAQSAGR